MNEQELLRRITALEARLEAAENLARRHGPRHFDTGGDPWQGHNVVGHDHASAYAPSSGDYLMGTSNASVTGEIVVGATPGGELGGTWASPTVDATHSGSAHHAQAHGKADHTEHANWKALYTDGSGDEQELALGASGTYYRSAGASSAPTMSAISFADLPSLPWTRTTATLSGDLIGAQSITPVLILLTSESGTTDNLAGFSANMATGDVVLLQAASGHTITVLNNSATASSGRRFRTVDGQSAVITNDGSNWDFIVFLKTFGGDLFEIARSIKANTRPIVLTAGAGRPTTTAGCASLATVEAGTNDVDYDVLDFDTATDEYAYWPAFVMPLDWDGGALYATPIWTAASGSGTVAWAVSMACRANDDAIDQAWGTAVTSTDTLITAGDVHVGPETTAITPSGTLAGGNLMFVRIMRDVSEDTLGVDARLMGLKLRYTTNRAVSG